MSLTVRIEEVNPENREAVSRLSVSHEQLAYVSPVGEMLFGVEERDGYAAYSIVVGKTPVGFLILALDPDAISHYACSDKPCGLEGYFIDAGRQGRGYGREAVSAVRTFVMSEFPERRTLDLTVNCRNTGAISTYLKSGFVDTGRLYHGGRSGPQHIFTMPLDVRKEDQCPSTHSTYSTSQITISTVSTRNSP